MKSDELTKKQAKKMLLVRDGMVHTFLNAPWGLMGADHELKSICKDIDGAYMCKLTGEQAQALGHGLVIIPNKISTQSDLIFVETKGD